jgi:hypothetical protein
MLCLQDDDHHVEDGPEQLTFEEVAWSYEPNVWGCAALRIFDREPFIALHLAMTA